MATYRDWSRGLNLKIGTGVYGWCHLFPAALTDRLLTHTLKVESTTLTSDLCVSSSTTFTAHLKWSNELFFGEELDWEWFQLYFLDGFSIEFDMFLKRMVEAAGELLKEKYQFC